MNKYNDGDVVYLKESAARGFLEPVIISAASKIRGSWIYSIKHNASLPLTPAVYGDKRSFVNTAMLYYSETEFVDACEAHDLAIAYLTAALTKLQQSKDNLC